MAGARFAVQGRKTLDWWTSSNPCPVRRAGMEDKVVMEKTALTTAEAAARISERHNITVPPATLAQWIARGQIPARKLGRMWFLEEKDVDAFTPPSLRGREEKQNG